MALNKDISPLLVVVLMIKNEASSIVETLENFFDQGCRYFVIFDTGSIDNTVFLCRSFFEKYPCVAHIKETEFVDFSTSRNQALDFAESCFPHAGFLLMSDAEWYLQGGDVLLSFCEQEIRKTTPLYLIDIELQSVQFTTARLFRNGCGVRFKGVVHEVPDCVATEKCPDLVSFDVRVTPMGAEKSRRRWQRDLLLLTKCFHENKVDPRTAFYLAQTYECLGLLESAFEIYQHREKLMGWDEENYITCFRLGCIAERLSHDSPQYSWDLAMSYYMKAFSMRPHRIEPLVKLADHYWPENIPACYLFIKYAYHLPYPKQDTLFIEREMYVYNRYEIMSRCAWHMGEFYLGEEATRLALSVHPNIPHLQNNLCLYETKNRENC